jgi:predicted nucleic acid-binding protein
MPTRSSSTRRGRSSKGTTTRSGAHVDATSFALVEREEVDAASAFDRHFPQRGLRVLPAQA